MHEILRRISLKWFYLSKYAKMLLLDLSIMSRGQI